MDRIAVNHQEPTGLREQLIAELRGVLQAIAGEQDDPQRVLADDAARLARALAAVAADGDVEAWVPGRHLALVALSPAP